MVAERYDAHAYWNARLNRNFNLRGTGHIGFSPSYNQWMYRRKDAVLAELLKGRTVTSVLDIGCGTGFFIDAFTRQRIPVVDGVDISETSVSRLRARYGGRFDQTDISDPGWAPSRTYDLVNVWDVLYHITDDTRFARAVRNLAAAAAPGGALLISDALGAAGPLDAAAHVRFRPFGIYDPLLRAAGLAPVARRGLYWLLNRRWGPADNALAPVYWAADTARAGGGGGCPSDNLSAGLWERPTSL